MCMPEHQWDQGVCTGPRKESLVGMSLVRQLIGLIFFLSIAEFSWKMAEMA